MDGSHDDILKLDATAEVDEFSKFLNEFEDELRTEKKSEATAKAEPAVTTVVEEATPAAAKRPRIDTERKVLDGKRLRKKVKPAKRERTPSMSPEGGGTQRRQSPLRLDTFTRLDLPT